MDFSVLVHISEMGVGWVEALLTHGDKNNALLSSPVKWQKLAFWYTKSAKIIIGVNEQMHLSVCWS